MRDLQQLERDLKVTREEIRHWQVVGMRPDMLPAAVVLVQSLERSARAEVKLLLKAIEHAKPE